MSERTKFDELPRRLRESAREVRAFPHPSHCDHLHVAFKVMLDAADALERQVEDAQSRGDVYPCVCIEVDDAGEVTKASLYAPGLPAGSYNVYPVGIENCATGEPVEGAQRQEPRFWCNWARDGIADFVADNWSDRKHTLAEIEAGIRTIEINPERVRQRFEAPAQPQAAPAGVPEGWISVEDRLPELHEPVIGWTDAAVLSVFERFDGGDGWLWAQQKWTWNLAESDGFEVDDDYEVTHWMPLPSAPQAPAPAGDDA